MRFLFFLDGSTHGWLCCLQSGQLSGQHEGACAASTEGIQAEEKTADGERIPI